MSGFYYIDLQNYNYYIESGSVIVNDERIANDLLNNDKIIVVENFKVSDVVYLNSVIANSCKIYNDDTNIVTVGIGSIGIGTNSPFLIHVSGTNVIFVS